MAVSFPARNKLAYPAGRVPGLDPSHPASKGLISFASPAGGGSDARFINRFGSAVYQVGAAPSVQSPSSTIDSIGPANLFVGSVGQGSRFSQTVIGAIGIGEGLTFGSIFTIRTAQTGLNTAIQASGESEGFYQAILGADDKFGLRLYGVQNFSSGIAPVAGASYFYGASVVYQGSSLWDHNHVVLRLDTGSLTPVAVTGTSSAAFTYFSNGFFIGGYDASGEAIKGVIAATMFGKNVLSLSQLIQWANDPWAFWYPSRRTDRVAAAAAAAAVNNFSNLLLMGVG